MAIKFDTRNKKPKLKSLLALTLAAAAAIGVLVWTDPRRHAAAACFVMAAYALGMILALLWAFREQLRYNPYSYNTIFYMGFAIFALSVMTSHIVMAVRVIRQPEIYTGYEFLHTLLGSAKTYMFISSPFLLAFSAALCVSNVSLIRHEGKRLVNLLGIILSFLLVAGLALLFRLDYAVSGSWREVMLHDIFVNLYAAIYLYFECMLIGIIVADAIAAKCEPERDKDFLIVLGCGLKKDGTPTNLLKGRLDLALRFARRQREETGRELTFVTSGGQGPDEVISESASMKRYLMEQGVPAERIIEEDRSTDTRENMRFSKEKIWALDPKAKVAFCTTNYHVFRSGLFARRVKMRAVGMGAETKWYFWPNAAVREFVGLLTQHLDKQVLILGSMVAAYVILTVVSYHLPKGASPLFPRDIKDTGIQEDSFMKRCREILALLLALTMLLSTAAFAAETPAGEKLDYGDGSSWAYFALGEDTGIDVFLVCPTVDTRSETNSFDLNDKLKGRFISALDMEKGIYEEAGRLYSPYYRQMSINAYRLPQAEQAQAAAVAYADVSDAFRWYLDHENGGRGLILAGFSQGSQMCLELMKEYFGGEGAEAAALREKLVAVYALGWTVTEEMTEAYPQIVPAAGETDTGTVVAFDCEDGSLRETMIIPAGTKALSINPLNWRTDGAEADRSLNLGAVMGAGAEPVEALCGAYIGSRGELVVTGVSPSDYPPGLDIFPEGSYHLYDYQFFFMNLKENVAARAAAWRSGLPFKDVAADAWYVPAVKAALESGRMIGTSPSAFSPDQALTRAQLVTVLWRMAGEPVVNYALPYSDVKADAWYADALRWAVSSALVEGGGSFGPKAAVTREETAQILWNYAKQSGADVSVGEDTNILSYADAFDITEGYHAPLQWALGSGVMEGTPEGYLEPQGQLTRAQAAAMLQRLDGALVPPASPSL